MKKSDTKHQPYQKIRNDGYIVYEPTFLDKQQSDDYLDYLSNEVPWEQQQVRIFGKWLDQPRLTAFYGDEGLTYTYSSLTLPAKLWTPPLLILKQAVEKHLSVKFNSTLLNYYRNGNDSMGWHSDDEASLGNNPIIASLSLGGERNFSLRHKTDKGRKSKIMLQHGSLLLMGGALQHFWQHQLPKTKRKVEPRINLTFRTIIN